MRCPNCGFESEDNFCRICQKEIEEVAEKSETEIVDNTVENAEPDLQVENNEKPEKQKKNVKKILFTTLIAIVSAAVVSASSIGVYSYFACRNQNKYFHEINQKYNFKFFDFMFSKIEKPKAVLKLNKEAFYSDKVGNIYLLEDAENDDTIDIDSLEKKIVESYILQVYYPVEFEFDSHSDDVLTFYPYDVNVTNPKQSSLYSEDVGFENTSDIVLAFETSEVSKRISAHSKETIKAQIIFTDYFAELPEVFKDVEFKPYNLNTDELYSSYYGSYYNSCYRSATDNMLYSLNANTEKIAEIDDLSKIKMPDEVFCTLQTSVSNYNLDSDNEIYPAMNFYFELPEPEKQ